MRNFLVLAFLVTSVAVRPAFADDVSVPVILVYSSDVGFKATNLGLLGSSLADLYVNGRGAAQIKAFREATAGVQWQQLDMGEFACIGMSAGEKCRALLRYDGDEHGLLEKLHADGVQRALLVSITQLFDGRRYRSRATLQDIEVGGAVLRTGRTLSAICESDVPAPVAAQAKGSAVALKEYWTSGEMPVLERVGRESLPEMARMLSVLLKTYPAATQSKPDGWDQLKGVAEFEADGRLKCHGACGGTRVFEAGESRIWLATTRSSGMFGWTLVSLDRETALINSNFLAYILTPTL